MIYESKLTAEEISQVSDILVERGINTIWRDRVLNGIVTDLTSGFYTLEEAVNKFIDECIPNTYKSSIKENKKVTKAVEPVKIDTQAEINKQLEIKKQAEAELEAMADVYTEIQKEINKNRYVPLATHKDIMTSIKDPVYRTYGAMMAVSNCNTLDKERENYLYYNRLDEVMELTKITKEDETKAISKKTLGRHIDKLEEKGLIKTVETANGLAYKLYFETDSKYYTTIPYKVLEELLVTSNGEMLKLYAVFSYQLKTDEWTKMDQWYLCNQIGLSGTPVQRHQMGLMCKGLAKMGLIKMIKIKSDVTVSTKTGKQVNKTPYVFRLTTPEEYEATVKLNQAEATLEELQAQGIVINNISE